jgi:hypothetical protein
VSRRRAKAVPGRLGGGLVARGSRRRVQGGHGWGR